MATSTLFFGFLVALGLSETLGRMYNASNFNFVNHVRDFRFLFGEYTPYSLVANYNATPPHFPGCEAKKLWLYVRNGVDLIENDEKKIIQGFQKLNRRIRRQIGKNKTHLTPRDRKFLTHWQPTSINFQFLRKLQQIEIRKFTRRLRSRFSQLFNNFGNFETRPQFNIYHKDPFYDDSAYVFYSSFLNPPKNNSCTVTMTADEPLTFNKLCQGWRDNVLKDPKTVEEVEKFKKSIFTRSVLEWASHLLGFRVNYDEIRLIKHLCAIQTFTPGLRRNNPRNERMEFDWCYLLHNKDGLEVLSYASDMEAYYKYDGGNGAENNALSCVALKDMYRMFTDSRTDRPNVLAYLDVEADAMFSLLGLLGIAVDDDEFTVENYIPLKWRKWKQSAINGLLSNLAFVLYDCQDMGLRVLTMHQERSVTLPGCPEGELCPLKYFEDTTNFRNLNGTCDYDELCSHF